MAKWDDILKLMPPEISGEEPKIKELAKAFADVVDARLPLQRGTFLCAALVLLMQALSAYEE
jgi:hypothetical protein